ncbi:MAG: ribosome rescue protein RqcH [Sulfolobales archaeon]
MSGGEIQVKRALSSLDLAVIIDELRSKIVDLYVDNVYTDFTGSLVVKLRSPTETYYLLLKPGERIHITRSISKLETSGKTTLFRRFLNDLRISSIKQLEFERIAVLGLEGKGVSYNLYIELIPRGIIALTDSNNKVLMVSKELKVKDRQVIIGGTYSVPPIYKDFRTLDIKSWIEVLSKYDNIQRGLIRGLGVPPEVVNEVISDEVLKEKICEDIVLEIKNRITSFIDRVVNNPQPVVLARTDGRYVSFMSFRPSKLADGLKILYFESLNEAVDEYFLKLTTDEVVTQNSKKLDDELSKTDKLLNELRNEIVNLTSRLNELKALHDITALNYNMLEDVLKCVWNTVKTYGWERISMCGISDYDRSRGVIKVRVDNVIIELNIREGVNNYLIKLKTQISECEDKIRKIGEVIEELLKKKSVLISEKESLSIPPLVKRVDWYDKYHWIITSDGFLAIGGRDSTQNEKLVRKYLNDDDVFLHADISGASAFILKLGDSKPSERSLFEVATLAACYSRGWKEGLGSLDVFWVYGSQVSKKPPAGEYLARGSFMIYGEKNYLRNVELRLAIGIIVIDGKYYKLVVGPEDYIQSRCNYYAVLRPGDESKESIAKKMIDYFVKSDARLRYVDLNEFLLRIPGPSRIDKLVASPRGNSKNS